MRVGAIGDRNIILRSNGPSGHPTIELKKSGTHGVQDSPTVEIITYKKQFDWD